MRWKTSHVLATACAIGLGLAGCGAGSPPPTARPNILMIMADDLGYSDIGAYGSEISTPNLDALAASGRLVTNYHTGSTCSPTRAMLMSGTDHHRAGLGSMAETIGSLVAGSVAPYGAANTYGFDTLPPGYEGYLNDRSLSMAQLLRDAGYHTYMAGKWHLASMPSAAPLANGGSPWVFRPASFPNAKGFERSYVQLQGGGSHFAPVPGRPTVADLGSVHQEDGQPVTLPADFYSSTTYTDKLIAYIDSNRGDGKPFFAYAAYTAPHWPLQAPDADIARYAGKYDEGYDVIRARRLARQKALGLVPADFSGNPGLDGTLGRPRWGSLTPAQRATEARKMAVYAAMVENLDRNIGRLIAHLKQTGAYDNTLIVFTSDNGAEGAASQFPDNANVDNSLGNIGRPLSNATYGERWAEVSATPFRLWKGMPAEGGVSAPMIVRLPGQTNGRPALHDLAHVKDLLPTFLAAAGIADPGATYAGKAVNPITGLSLLARLDGADGPDVRAGQVLADELFGGRYVIRDGWKMVSMQPPFGDNSWALYDLRNDRGETRDLAAAQPEIADRLRRDYDAWAGQAGVVWLPIPSKRPPAP
ncbi:arylsulfatase [Pseudoduganella lutea]|uniref:Arylsulfatase n=1 Tax=Pseudoduganella lutea TaxID=321985 RepID=A0A4P6KTN5_9BURK|nr:arylsulfatase [Pseudoduganella lutea]QBE61935.1 arylsulfatase [Pseudoduganella lutea]